MHRIILPVVLCCISVGSVFSQCAESPKPKVLLVGDSWASYMNFDQTINKVFKTWGHSGYTYVTSSIIAENGADTWDFLKANKQAEIQRLINLNPSIELVHLSIGGNDFLGDWKVSFSQGRTDSLEDEVYVRLDSIMRFIKSTKPGMRILWSGYTYPNFEEPITAPGFLSGSAHPFYGTWEGMEFPTFIQINTILNNVSARMEAYAANDPQVDFVNATGILQYTTGQTTPICCGITPQGTYAPRTVPLPYGDPNYPSPISTMRDYFSVTKDCFHLSAGGYFDLVSYHAQKFYHKFLMDDLYILSENNTQTGTVTSLGNVSDSLFLGEAGGEQFATVLSFNTTGMADTTLTKASIFLRRNSLSGTNPISGSLEVKVKNGNFGTTVDVEAADFSAAGDASATPCLFGSNLANGDWIRLDLPAQILPYIDNAAATQFIISAPGFTGGTVNFYNSTDPDFAPVLNLDYITPVSGVDEVNANSFSVYPNPTNDRLTIENNGETILQVEVVDLLGKVVLRPHLSANTIDISSIPSGMYILNVATKSGSGTQRVFKY